MFTSGLFELLYNDMDRFWRRYGLDPEGFRTRVPMEAWLAMLMAGGYQLVPQARQQEMRDRFHRLTVERRLSDEVASLAIEAMEWLTPPGHRYREDIRRVNHGCLVLLPPVPWTKIDPIRYGYNGAFILAMRESPWTVPERLNDLSTYAASMNLLAHTYHRRNRKWQRSLLFLNKSEAIIRMVRSFPRQASLVTSGRGLYCLTIRGRGLFHIPGDEAIRIMMHLRK